MNLRRIDLNLLTVFEALMLEGNMTRAADRLGMSQPAMSNALSRLRQQLNDPLFVRTAAGMEPTVHATALYGPVSQALENIRLALEARTGFDPGASDRCFTLSVGDYGEQMFLPVLMGAMRQQAPGVSVSVDLQTGEPLQRKLQQGQIDLAFDYLPLQHSGFENEQLGLEEVVVVGSQFNRKLSDSLSVEDYLAMPHAVLKNRDRIGTPLEIVLGRKQLNRHSCVEVSHMLAMPSVVAYSDLLCTIPRRLAEFHQQMLPLKIMPLPFELEPFPVYMIWHHSYEHDAGHQWLRQQVHELSKSLLAMVKKAQT